MTLAAAWCSVVFLAGVFLRFAGCPASWRKQYLRTGKSLHGETARQASVWKSRSGADSADVAAGRAFSKGGGSDCTSSRQVPSTPIYFQELGTAPENGRVRGERKIPHRGLAALVCLGFDFRFSMRRSTLEAVTILMDAILPFVVLMIWSAC